MKYSFAELRDTYTEIKHFLENASGLSVQGLNTKIAEDLGLWGDDNYFLLEQFASKYELNFDKFDYNRYFESEGELFNGTNALIGLLILPFLILAQMLKWLFPKLKTPLDSFFLPMKNIKSDLTFGDLIVCKLKGEFSLRKDVQIEMQN